MKNCQPCAARFQMIALTALRMGAGFIMAAHGYSKLTNLQATTDMFAGMGMSQPVVYLAIAGELLGGLGLLVGLLTRVAAFGIFSVMTVAILKVHLQNGLMAQNHGFEYPLTMGLVALFFISNGAGCLSLDALCCCRKNKECCSEKKECCTEDAGAQPPQ